MLKGSFFSGFIILGCMITLGFYANHNVLAADCVGTKERLVTGSPLVGSWEAVLHGLKGDLEIEFKEVDGKFRGFITKATNTGTNSAVGEVSDLKVNDSGVVEFQSITGGRYYLSFDEEGKLSGPAFVPSPAGLITLRIKLNPKVK